LENAVSIVEGVCKFQEENIDDEADPNIAIRFDVSMRHWVESCTKHGSYGNEELLFSFIQELLLCFGTKEDQSSGKKDRRLGGL
jgi:hypothetical protein